MPFPATEALLAAAEDGLGRRLPEPLRGRLLRDNGGEVMADGEEWTLHPVWDPTDRRRMARTASHVVHETAQARQWRGFPDDAVAIASNGYGDLLILRGGSDAVEFWNHETGASQPVAVEWEVA